MRWTRTDVAVTNVDDETVGITLTPVSGPTSETGGAATFTVVLDSEPSADVTIGLTSSDLSEGTVSPASLTFTPTGSGIWSTPQTVTVTGVDDLVADGSVAYAIVTAGATSTDPNYSGLDAADPSVTNVDDENGRDHRNAGEWTDIRSRYHGDLHRRAEHATISGRDDRPDVERPVRRNGQPPRR